MLLFPESVSGIPLLSCRGPYYSVEHIWAKNIENEISLMFTDFPTVKVGCHSEAIHISSILDSVLDGKIDYILTL